MKTKITVGVGLLLTLGSALAGGGLYHKEQSTEVSGQPPAVVSSDAVELTPELIAKWKATSATADYSPAMLPI